VTPHAELSRSAQGRAAVTHRTPVASLVVLVQGVTEIFGGAAARKGVNLDLRPEENHALRMSARTRCRATC